MNNSQIQTMDIHILVSLLNMKLRNDFTHLQSLCYDSEFAIKELNQRLHENNFIYNKAINQIRPLHAQL